MSENSYAPYDAAFCAPDALPVFQGIVGGHHVYQPDPYDVPEVHREARRLFDRLAARHTGPHAPDLGSILLLKGRAGAGKTHLMRAFRDRVHRDGTGYFGYLQLTSKSDNYHRYVLSALVEHLQQPYHVETDPRSGLRRLSDALAENSAALKLTFPDTGGEALATLREGEMSQSKIIWVVEHIAPIVLRERRFANIDIDLVRALLYLQTGNPVLENRVKKYLRAEHLTTQDETALGGIRSLTTEDAPARMLAQLGHLMWQTGHALLVIGVDQIENIASMDNASERFQRAVNALTALANAVPSCIVVLACLEDYYIGLRGHLFGSNVDRLEQDPEPLLIGSRPDGKQIAAILARRLSRLYEAAGLPVPEPPTYPLTERALETLPGLTIRDVLAFARNYQEQCAVVGAILAPPLPGVPVAQIGPPPPDRLDAMRHAWNDHLHGVEVDVPAKSDELAQLLDEGIGFCRAEVPALAELQCERRETIVRLNGLGEAVLVGVCNRASAGGGFLRELQAFTRHLDGQRPVIVRAAGFPRPVSQTGQFLANLAEQGGKHLQIENNEWRAVLAMRSFCETHAQDSTFQEWLEDERPLTRLPGFRALLDLETLEKAVRAAVKPAVYPPDDTPERETAPVAEQPVPASEEPVRRTAPAAPSPEGPSRPILLGKTTSRLADDVTLDPAELTRHAAFLGGTGSGKTTLAMRLVEGLLFRGVPALLLDRKGDLCGYADAGAWNGTAGDMASRAKLRDRIEPVLYTPGHPHGRPLRLTLLPPGMAALDDFERGQVADFCASSLCGMMGFGNSSSHKAQRSLLKASLDLYGQTGVDDPPLEDVIAFIGERDPKLLAQVGNLKSRVFDDLIQNLEVLRIGKENLFTREGTPLDVDQFFSPATGGRTRVTIISTKFLGDQADVEFWVAQLFIELGRWINTRPSASLQGVVFCDEADLYLPAQRQPATKQPMENLLKRARSAGLGMLLATQSPGDFDYKCRDNIRTWFLGKLKEPTALQKMKPMLQQYGGGLANRLPTQETGQFVLANEQRVTPFAAERCLVAPEQRADDRILEIAAAGR